MELIDVHHVSPGLLEEFALYPGTGQSHLTAHTHNIQHLCMDRISADQESKMRRQVFFNSLTGDLDKS